MREQLQAYFTAEAQGAMLLFIVGVATIGAAIFLVAQKSSYRGMAVPFVFFALIELGIGAGVWWRTDKQVAQLLRELDTNPATMARGELARMERVVRNFHIVKIVEIAFLAAGVVLAYKSGRSDFAFAAGVGFILQSGFLLAFDFIAGRRADVYVEALRAVS